MRADGDPSLVAVASVMALGSGSCASCASANQRANSTNGSWLTSASSRRAWAYSRRRSEMDMPSKLTGRGLSSSCADGSMGGGDAAAIQHEGTKGTKDHEARPHTHKSSWGRGV